MRIEVPLHCLLPTERNSRTHYSRVPELADSISRYGLLQNLIVTKTSKRNADDEELYEVKGGERRRRALALLASPADEQLKQYGETFGHWDSLVPVLVIPESSAEAVNLIENIQREDLFPWELGRRFMEMNDAGFDQVWIGVNIGKSQGYVSQMIQIGRGLSPKLTQKLEKMGRNILSFNQLLRLSKLYDYDLLEPLEEKQLAELERVLGQTRRREPAPKTPRQVVYERFKRMQHMKVPGHARPYVEAMFRYLAGETQKPKFTWK